MENVMWVLFARAAPPDARYWPGRRWLATLDAIGWPTFWLIVLGHVAARTGVVGPVLMSLVMLVGARRVCTAIWQNQRYRFTTWRWARPLLALLLVGLAIKHVPLV